ncbi:MAG TPA: energy transducer TonB [Thermoanaerobaculia bacterium]
MFETVAPAAFARRDRHVFYESLPASIALHAIAIGAVAVAIASNVTLPAAPPKLLVAYLASDLAEPVPPPPPPAAPAKQSDAPKQETTLAASVALAPIDLAPSIIPDEIEQMPPPSPFRLVSATVDKFVPAAGVDGGVGSGAKGGVAGGVSGGASGGVAGGMVGGDGRMHFERDAQLPLFPEEHSYPDYPDICINARMEGSLVVKYVIGKDGHVNEVSILHHAERKEFDASALDAVRKWKFRPLIVDGVAMEVVHELTVYFRLY